MSPEHQCLLACISLAPGPERRQRLEQALVQRPDWASLQELCRFHGVVPLAFQALERSTATERFGTELAAMQAAAREIGLANIARTADLLALLRRFERQGIAVLSFKGPLLGESVYGSIADRPFEDLDLLVDPRDFGKAREMLLADGYRSAQNLDLTQEEVQLASIRQLSFQRKEGGAVIDLHAALMPDYLRFPLDFSQLWRRRVAQPLAGTTVATLSPEDLLLLLCVHGAKHMYFRLLWLIDFARLSATSLDWDRLRRQARRLGCGRRLDLGLLLARDLLGTELPAEVRVPVADPNLRQCQKRVCQLLFAVEPRLPTAPETCLWHLKVCDHLRDGVRYCLGTVFNPCPLDSWEMPFATATRPLYTLWRPVRLLGKYAARFGKARAMQGRR